jgi:hypothetical protein
MPSTGHGIQLLSLVLTAALCGGCVSEQQSEFRGNITQGLAATNNFSIEPYCWEFSWRDPLNADALAEFGVPQGFIILVHSREKYEHRDYQIRNDGVSAVYFYERKLPIDGKEFLDQDVIGRDRIEGMHRLHGSFNVEKWRSNIDFRIRFAMHSSEPNRWVVNGTLVIYETREFNPVKYVGQGLGAMGFAHK